MITRFLVCGLVALFAATIPQRAVAQKAAPAGPDTVAYKSARGAVTFTHATHAKLAECASCHHESKAEKPLATPHQQCGACHTNPATAPVTTARKAAFHDVMKKEGTCLSCHKKEIEAGKAAPVACADCHKRAGG